MRRKFEENNQNGKKIETPYLSPCPVALSPCP